MLLQDILAALAAFTSLPDPKDAASFSQLARLPVRNTAECTKLIETLGDSVFAHPRNRVSAGPSVVRRVCELMSEGWITDKPRAHRWCALLRLLFAEKGAATADSKGEANMHEFVAAGGVGLLLRNAERFRENPEMSLINLDSLCLLSHLSQETQWKLLSGGCWKLLHSILATHLHSSRIQFMGCSLAMDIGYPIPGLGSMWACKAILGLSMDGEINDAMVLSGCLSRFYAGMDAHVDDHEVQSEICNALSIGLTRIYAAMVGHSTSASVQASACAVLRILVEPAHGTVPFTIATTGGLALVLTAMDTHLSSVDVQEVACLLLVNLAARPENHQPIVRNGALERLYAVMDAYSTPASLVESACIALGNVSRDTAVIRKVVDGGGLDRLLAALGSHPTVESLQQSVLAGLFNIFLGMPVRAVPPVKAERAVTLVRRVMGIYPSNSSVQEYGRSILLKLIGAEK